MPAGRSGPQLTASSQGRGEGKRGRGSFSDQDDNVGRLLICCVADDDDEAGQQQRPPVHGGRLGCEDDVVEDTVSSSGDRRPGTEAVWGWAAHLEDGERRMPPTPTSSLLPQLLAWWHTARYTQISATLGQISQNILMQRRDDLKTYNSFRYIMPLIPI